MIILSTTLVQPTTLDAAVGSKKAMAASTNEIMEKDTNLCCSAVPGRLVAVLGECFR